MSYKIAPAAVALAVAALPQVAQAQIVAEVNAARANGNWGAELGVGTDIVSLGGFKIRPIAGVFAYSRGDDRYYLDRNSLEPTDCRDRETGFFVKRDRCDGSAARFYAKAEATYTILGSVEAGLGARYSVGDLTPYATASLPIAPLFRIKANIGDDYYALGVRASF